jgi:hypothetical protein
MLRRWVFGVGLMTSGIRIIIVLIAILVSQGYTQTTPGPKTGYLKQAEVTETGGVVRISANSPRPLLETIDALQRKYGWIIGYEDPRYISHLDVVDVSDPSEPQVPAGGQFSVEFPGSEPPEEKILSQVINSYNQSKNPGRFELRRTVEGNFYVEGIAAHDEKDEIAPQRPLFDLPMTFAVRETNLGEIIDEICKTVSGESHVSVVLGNSPANILAHTTVKVGGANVAAREILVQALAAAHRNLYWRVLFDPASKSYFLDIHAARAPAGMPENEPGARGVAAPPTPDKNPKPN